MYSMSRRTAGWRQVRELEPESVSTRLDDEETVRFGSAAKEAVCSRVVWL